ncbi:hypothetical protein DFR51_0213 [Sphingosinicella microcystinivorans]|uniref:Uncharacterized protein n=1 Tax=Sphingosinicella microcystinivorans TaxID=335406 RepID=A0ABX9SZT1_SPHMI|nr:hypothetical protein DFR51_0213 [Sphingosinicella microcystinivorans]
MSMPQALMWLTCNTADTFRPLPCNPNPQPLVMRGSPVRVGNLTGEMFSPGHGFLPWASA